MCRPENLVIRIALMLLLAVVPRHDTLFAGTVSINVVPPSLADCRDVAVVDSNVTLRRLGPECFDTYLETPGLLTLDVAVRGEEPVEPRLDFMGPVCGTAGDTAEDFRYLERSPASTAIDVGGAGSYVFCVTAQDPRLELNGYKLRVGFAADPVQAGCEAAASAVTACVDRGGDPSEAEPDPEPVAANSPVCRSGELDDHGDTRSCATALGFSSPVYGEIENDWRDDDDYFVFGITELETVEVEVVGGVDAAVGLFDEHGQRLSTGRSDEEVPGSRMVKTLVPGRYFVRVEGRGQTQGPYRLTARTVAWRQER